MRTIDNMKVFDRLSGWDECVNKREKAQKTFAKCNEHLKKGYETEVAAEAIEAFGKASELEVQGHNEIAEANQAYLDEAYRVYGKHARKAAPDKEGKDQGYTRPLNVNWTTGEIWVDD